MGKQNKTNKEMFEFLSKRYHINNIYPTLFNGKKVCYFDEENRPIGENNIDLIDDYWNSVKGGFSVNGGVESINKIYRLNYNQQSNDKVIEISQQQKTSLTIDCEYYNYKGDTMKITNDEENYQYNSEIELYEAILLLETSLKSKQQFTLKDILKSEEIKNKIQLLDKLNYNLYEKIEEIDSVEMSGNWDINKAETRLFIFSDEDIAYYYTIKDKILIDVIVDDEFTSYTFYVADNTLFVSKNLLDEALSQKGE